MCLSKSASKKWPAHSAMAQSAWRDVAATGGDVRPSNLRDPQAKLCACYINKVLYSVNMYGSINQAIMKQAGDRTLRTYHYPQARSRMSRIHKYRCVSGRNVRRAATITPRACGRTNHRQRGADNAQRSRRGPCVNAWTYRIGTLRRRIRRRSTSLRRRARGRCDPHRHMTTL